MTDKDNCANPVRECPIDSVWVQEHGVMKSQIEEMYKVNKSTVVIKWAAIIISVAVISFGAGREISLESKSTTLAERGAIAASMTKLNDKLDLSIKEITQKIDINSNRLTAIEATMKP
jgi:hypothetical protein